MGLPACPQKSPRRGADEAKEAVLNWDILLNLREAEIGHRTVNAMNHDPVNLVSRRRNLKDHL